MLCRTMRRSRSDLPSALLLTVVAGVQVAGCHHDVGRSNLAQPGPGVAVFDMDATRRGIVVVRQPDVDGTPGKILTCPEAPPDVALETVREITANLSAAVSGGGSGSVDVARSLQESIRQLNPTSEATTFLRSTLGSICWLSTNTSLTQEQTTALINSSIEAARQLAMRQVALDIMTILSRPAADGEEPQLRLELVRALQLLLVGTSGMTTQQIESTFQQ